MAKEVSWKKKQAFKIFAMSPVELGAQGINPSAYGIAKQVGASMPSITKWRKEYNEIIAKGEKPALLLMSDEFDIIEYLKAHRKEIAKGLVMSSQAGNPSAQKVALTLTGDYEEKQKAEITIGLSADEIARRNLEANRQLEEWNSKAKGESNA